MDRQEALEVLGIVSDKSIIDTIKFEYKDLLFRGKDKEGIIKRTEACKILTDGHKDQTKIFSDFVVSAIEDNHLDFLRLLLETVKNSNEFDYLNAENTVGNIPLNSVLENKYNKCDSRVIAVNLLLEHGANPNTKDWKGESSLHYLVKNKYDNFCHMVIGPLFQYNADPNIQDHQGRTPLHTLCIEHQYGSNSGLVEIVKLLVRGGANLDLKDKNGKKAVHYVNPKTDVGRLLGATDKDAVWIKSGGIACCLFFGIGCMVESTVGNFSKADRTMCTILALISVSVALYFAYHLKEELQKQPLPELTEVRTEFPNGQQQKKS